MGIFFASHAGLFPFTPLVRSGPFRAGQERGEGSHVFPFSVGQHSFLSSIALEMQVFFFFAKRSCGRGRYGDFFSLLPPLGRI